MTPHKIVSIPLCHIFLWAALLTACASTAAPQPAPTPTSPAPTQAKAAAVEPSAQLDGGVTSTAQAPVTGRAAVIQKCAALLSTFEQQLKTTGWIRKVFTRVYFDNPKNEYQDPQINEEWYRFDSDNKLVEGYNWLTTPDGAILQEVIYQGGAVYNLTYGGSSRQYNDRVDFTAGFLDKLTAGKNIALAEVDYQGMRSWRFSYEINEGGINTVDALYIDLASGLINGSELSVVQPDGSLKLVSGSVGIKYEIDADPPLERFQALLLKAQNTH